MTRESEHSQQRYYAMAVREIYAAECQSCGVCCVAYNQVPFGIPVNPNLPVPKKLVQIGYVKPSSAGSNRYMRIEKLKDKKFTGNQEMNKCVALYGKVREHVTCNVYEVRPNACYHYHPGSPACLASRAWAKMETPVDLMWLGRS